MAKPITAIEYGYGTPSDNDILIHFINDDEQSQLERLGVHKTQDGYRALHYVGAVWLSNKKERIPLIVNPKISVSNQILDPVAMLDEAVQYPEFFEPGEEASQEPIFTVFDDQESITANQSIIGISMFQVAWYLKELSSFCHRKLRQGFVRVDENLIGKVKGKILIDQHLRSNLVRGRADRMICRFENMTIDTLPNRILRYALRLSTGFLNQKYSNSLNNFWLWARQAESALSGVTLTSVTLNDFRDIRYGGSLSSYKPIHILAKAIIANLRLDATGDVKSTGNISPFALNMNTLYEAYVGVQLKKAGLVNLLPQKEMVVLFGNWKKNLRPDYCSPCGRLVIDAKYKRYLENNDDRISDDLEQLLSYSILVPVWMKSKNYITIDSKVSLNEHWAFLVVPTLKQEAISIGNDNFPKTVGDIMEMQFPKEGMLRAGVIECPVPMIDIA